MESQLEGLTATSLLEEQLTRLEDVRHLDYKSPLFIRWRNTITTLFQRFLSQDSPHFHTFRELEFRALGPIRTRPFSYRGPLPPTGMSPADKARFQKDCDIAAECIKAALEEIRALGVYSGSDPARTANVRTFHQNFNAPVTFQNQAIATDNSIQLIGQMGDTGTGLEEIRALLDQSMEITGREKSEGFQALKNIASEVQKPSESRNWKSILDCGEKLVGIASKATDMAIRLAPHMPVITVLVEEAVKKLHGG